MISSEEYYQTTIEHRKSHRCGGMPYTGGEFLTKLPKALGVNDILEIGTSIGYSAYCFASASKDVRVTTIDMNAEHEEIAAGYWSELGIDSQIQMIIGMALDVLPTLTNKYDIIFFDGFAPDPNEVFYYEKLLKEHGVVVTTNISWNKTTPEYIARLENYGVATNQYYDTAISSRSKKSLELSCNAFEDAIELQKVSS